MKPYGDMMKPKTGRETEEGGGGERNSRLPDLMCHPHTTLLSDRTYQSACPTVWGRKEVELTYRVCFFYNIVQETKSQKQVTSRKVWQTEHSYVLHLNISQSSSQRPQDSTVYRRWIDTL